MSTPTLDLDLYTLAELRDLLRSCRERSIAANETLITWCNTRTLTIDDPAYLALRAAADDMSALGDQVHAEVRRRQADAGGLDLDRIAARHQLGTATTSGGNNA